MPLARYLLLLASLLGALLVGCDLPVASRAPGAVHYT